MIIIETLGENRRVSFSPFFFCFFAQLGSTQSRSGALHYEQDGRDEPANLFRFGSQRALSHQWYGKTFPESGPKNSLDYAMMAPHLPCLIGFSTKKP